MCSTPLDLGRQLGALRQLDGLKCKTLRWRENNWVLLTLKHLKSLLEQNKQMGTKLDTEYPKSATNATPVVSTSNFNRGYVSLSWDQQLHSSDCCPAQDCAKYLL